MEESKLTQRTIIAHWLVEIYLDDLDHIGESEVQKKAVMGERLKSFLQKYKSILDYRTTKSLIAKHGHADLVLAYSTIKEDWPEVIRQLVDFKQYKEALRVMMDSKKKLSSKLFYTYGPLLFSKEPKLQVHTWTTTPIKLEVRKLIPALTKYDPFEMNEREDGIHWSIQYLLYCVVVQGNKEEIVHNTLLSMFCQLEDEKPLITFLHYPHLSCDLKFALRTTLHCNKKRSASIVYAKMALFEEAVELSLQVSPELAKDYVKMVDDAEERCKKLWISIGCPFLSFQIFPNLSNSFQIFPNLSKSFQIFPNLSKSFQIFPFSPLLIVPKINFLFIGK